MGRTEVRGEQIKDASVSLTADVTGVLPAANGGTGASSITAAGIVDTTSTQSISGQKTLTDPKINTVKDVNGASALEITAAASAVNYLGVANRAAGAGAYLYAEGAGTNLDIVFSPKGTGGLYTYSPSASVSAIPLTADGVAAAVGWNLQTTGSARVQVNGVNVPTVSSSDTETNKTFTAPVISATTASAGSAMKLTSGTVMTTPEAGAFEYDGTVFYQTPAAGNRGLSPTYAMCRLDSAYTLTSTTSVQKLFNSSTNGALTVPVGTYRFNCLLSLSSMSATSGNGAFSLAGTATVGTVLMYAIGRDGSVNTVATLDGTLNNTAAFPNPMHTAQTAAGLQTFINGTFEVTVTGTLIPSFALNTAASAVVAAGSYFECWPVGSTTVATIGNWS